MDVEQLRASDGNGPAAPASVTSARSSGASTLQVSGVTNWPDKFIGTYGVLNAETQTLNLDTVRVFFGHLDGSDIIIDDFAPGFDDDGNSVGDKVYIKPATAFADLIVDYLLVSLDEDGTLSDAAIAQVTNAIEADANFRPTPRVNIQTTTATLTPDIDTDNQYVISAQGSALAVVAPTGTAHDGDVMIVLLKDDGTTRAVTYNAIYVNISGLDSIANTVAGKWHTLGFRYSAALTKWHIVSISTEA